MEQPEQIISIKKSLKSKTPRGIKRIAYFKRKSQIPQQQKTLMGEIRFSISKENQKILKWLNAYLRQ